MFSLKPTLALPLGAFALAALLVVPTRLTATPEPPPTDDNTIVDVAVAGGFETLVAAVKAAGLVEALQAEGPFTVFAPTDEAFAKLPSGTLESLLKPENKDQLVAILTYHVVPGKVKAKDVAGLKQATTLQGSTLKVSVMNGTVMINDAHVVATDVMASNGVVHVIDTVLLPPAK